MSSELYRCPILDEGGTYDEDFPAGKYDPRHYETLPKMIEHLRNDNDWTDKQIADWQETTQPE